MRARSGLSEGVLPFASRSAIGSARSSHSGDSQSRLACRDSETAGQRRGRAARALRVRGGRSPRRSHGRTCGAGGGVRVYPERGALRRPAASTLPLASEACFSIEEHLGVVGRPRQSTRGHRAGFGHRPRIACDSLRRELLPVWEGVRNEVRIHARVAGVSLSRPLDARSRCVSPSDFGFHNALVAIDGRATLPGFRIRRLGRPSQADLRLLLPAGGPRAERRFDSFARPWPRPSRSPGAAACACGCSGLCIGVKWVCIRLNEFLTDGGRRRRFAADGGFGSTQEPATGSGPRRPRPASRRDRRFPHEGRRSRGEFVLGAGFRRSPARRSVLRRDRREPVAGARGAVPEVSARGRTCRATATTRST